MARKKDPKKKDKKVKTIKVPLDVWKILMLNKVDLDLDSVGEAVQVLLEDAGQYPSPLFSDFMS